VYSTAFISPEKIRDYLLSPAQPIGRYKSAFFQSLGYQQILWPVLERDIRALLGTVAAQVEAAAFGKKLVIRGTITGPNGRSAGVVSVWIILADENVLRFVTAYPED
jgi:hypothetical protein